MALCPDCESGECLSYEDIALVSPDASVQIGKSLVEGVTTFSLTLLKSFNLAVEDSQSIALSGDGSNGDPLVATAKLSTQDGNLLTLADDGLLVLAEGLVETANSKTDSDTTEITLSGTASRNIKVDVKISEVADNAITVVDDGLYVALVNPTPGLTLVETDDTATIQFSGNGRSDNPLSASVKISATSGNILDVESDGLYVPGLRFGVSGEDDTAGEDRIFVTGSAYSFAITSSGSLAPPFSNFAIGETAIGFASVDSMGDGSQITIAPSSMLFTNTIGDIEFASQVRISNHFWLGAGTFNSSLLPSLQMKNGTGSLTAITDGILFWADDIIAGNSAPHFKTEAGDVIKLFKGAALTAADGGAINSGDGGTDTIIANLRTRIGELEARLQAHGLLT